MIGIDQKIDTDNRHGEIAVNFSAPDIAYAPSDHPNKVSTDGVYE